MLLGLLAEGTSTASQILTTAGVTFDAVQHQIVQLLGFRSSPSSDIPRPDQMPFAPRAKRVLELAREQADQVERSHVTPDHLLLGILDEEGETPEQYRGVAIRILGDKCGLDLTQLEQQLRATMSQ